MSGNDYFATLNNFGTGALQDAQQNQLSSNVAKINLFNKNPRMFNRDESAQILAMAQQLGLDTNEGLSKDKATLGENVVAGLGGTADALLFGLIPDKWYSNYRTNTSKSTGKVAGSLLSFLIPGFGASAGMKSFMGIGKGAVAGAKTAMTASKAQAAATLVKAAKGAKAAKAAKTATATVSAAKKAGDLVALTKLLISGGVSGGKAAYAVAMAAGNASKTAKLLEMAHALIRLNQTASNLNIASNPSMYGEQSPYSTMNTMGGMPPVQ